MIHKIIINNLRKFENITLDINKNTVVIVGDNTKGKSTILEALYLLTNGETPWGEFDDEFNDKQKEEDRFVRIEIKNKEKSYAYFRDNKKKQLKLDGRNVQSKTFYEKISSVLFSPEQIEILMISGSKRREFLDKLISRIDYEYADNLSKFNKALKQRNAYLKKLSKILYETNTFKTDDIQLSHWTKIFSKYCVYIMKKRQEVIDKLKTNEFEIVYKPSVVFNLFEDLAKDNQIQEIVYNMIMEKVKRDIALGYTNLGSHRDDWTIFQGKDIKRFGSRGEKRIAIGKLIFLTLEILAEVKENRPILLLDDIPSELDKRNSQEILSEGIIGKQQSFITTLDLKYIPKKVLKEAQIIDLNLL